MHKMEVRVLTIDKKIKLGLVLALLLGFSSCTRVNEMDNEPVVPGIRVVKIDRFENMEISDWLDESTVLVSKENTSLDKMSLSELADSYPRSLYLYNVEKEKYQLLREVKELYLGGAVLSPDKKNLLHYEFSLGDPSFSILNMDSLTNQSISGAMSAKWADDETVIGASYSGGAYLYKTTGKISPVEGLEGEGLVIVEKIEGDIFYNTSYDEGLWKLDLSSLEKTDLSIDQVYGIYPSPNGKQMLVIQMDGNSARLLLYDNLGEKGKLIAENTEINGVSWSDDNKRIAYNSTGLNVYTLETDESEEIDPDIRGIITTWSPSGDKLAFTEWDGSEYNSGIIHLE